jgi:hypothetical protein
MCQVASKANLTPTKHNSYQVYASGGSGEDYLGTSSYQGSTHSCFLAGHMLTEARIPGKTIGKDHEMAAQLGA